MRVEPVILSLSAFLSACVSTPIPQADEATIETAAINMTPHFECALYFNEIEQPTPVTESINTASEIGENHGLSPSQIMYVYSQAKTVVNEQVLARAIDLSKNDPSRLPRLDGSSPPPRPKDELKAWNDVYSERC